MSDKSCLNPSAFVHNFAKQLPGSSLPSRWQAWPACRWNGWQKIFECICQIINSVLGSNFQCGFALVLPLWAHCGAKATSHGIVILRSHESVRKCMLDFATLAGERGATALFGGAGKKNSLKFEQVCAICPSLEFCLNMLPLNLMILGMMIGVA